MDNFDSSMVTVRCLVSFSFSIVTIFALHWGSSFEILQLKYLPLYSSSEVGHENPPPGGGGGAIALEMTQTAL